MSSRRLALPLFIALAALFFIDCASPVPPSESAVPSATDLQAIQEQIDEQARAWNNGDIDAFMQTYWHSDSLRFASGGAVRRGWQETLERYKAAYPSREAMGTLSFEDLDLRRLSPSWAMAFGRFRLKREDPLPDLTGLFTLIFEKKDEGWVIVHDHTSAEG